jgi:hypothetical protein
MRAAGASGRDTVIDHRQHQPAPIAIAGRIDRMDDQLDADGGRHHIVPHHRIAAQPFQAVASASRHLRRAMQGLHPPAARHQQARHLAADAAGGAQYQSRFHLFHAVLLK